jgi:hypothetical protein
LLVLLVKVLASALPKTALLLLWVSPWGGAPVAGVSL